METYAYGYDNAKLLQNFVVGVYLDKISMLEATKTEQELVINKLQTEVVKLKEKVRHLCKLRQDLLEQRSVVEDKVRALQKERDSEIAHRESRIRELEDELEQYECKMEYLEHTQVHLQRSLLASENKTPKLLEQLEKTSQELDECRDELDEKSHRIEELTSSVHTKEAMIERLQNDLKAFKREAAAEMEKRFLSYTEEKERLMGQLQEETEEYVKAAFAEKDGQLRELNEQWQDKYDLLNEEMSALRKELEDTIAEKNDLMTSQAESSSSEEEVEEENVSTEESSDESSEESEEDMVDYQVQERIERFREELSRLHELNSIEQKSKYEKQMVEVKEKLEQKIMLLKKQHEEELKEFDQLLNDELNRVHKKYQCDIRRLKEQANEVRYNDDFNNKVDKGIQAFVGALGGSQDSLEFQDTIEDVNVMKQLLSDVQDQLELKENEVIKLRNEASNQIRNVESYWQERLNKELKELTIDRDHEFEELKDDLNKQIKQLNEKINSLQTIMKLTGQDQPIVTSPIVEEPSTDEEEVQEVEASEEQDADSEEEASYEDISEDTSEEMVELSPCPQRLTPFRQNPLVTLPSGGFGDRAGSSEEPFFPRSLLKKSSSSSGDCELPRKCKRVSFADAKGESPVLLVYNPNISAMDILKPIEEQFRPKKKRSSFLPRSMRRSVKQSVDLLQDQTQF